MQPKPAGGAFHHEVRQHSPEGNRDKEPGGSSNFTLLGKRTLTDVIKNALYQRHEGSRLSRVIEDVQNVYSSVLVAWHRHSGINHSMKTSNLMSSHIYEFIALDGSSLAQCKINKASLFVT